MPIFRQITPEQMVEARALTQDERQALHDDDLRFKTHVALLIAVLLGIAACMLHCVRTIAGPAWSYWPAVGAAVTAFGAALGTGGVLGFLFGVPGPEKGITNNVTNAGTGTVALATGKDSVNAGGDIDGTAGKPPAPIAPLHKADATRPAPAKDLAANSGPGKNPLPDPTKPSGPARGNSSASNLEQVADWVTKLLLGGGLTQIQRIPPKIWSWARMVALGILGPAGGTETAIVAQQAFAAGLLVYGFILGFFSGLIITKLQLGKAITGDPVN